MALRKFVRSNYGGKSLVSIKHENLHSFKEGVILLCQNILETIRISHLHGSALFTIPLNPFKVFILRTLKALELRLTRTSNLILLLKTKIILRSLKELLILIFILK